MKKDITTPIQEEAIMNIDFDIHNFFKQADVYNVDIISTRNQFVEDFDTYNYKLLLRILGFNLDSKSDYYRWGKRVIRRCDNWFSWVSTDCNGNISVFRKNSETNKTEKKLLNPFITKEAIKEHVCSSKTRKTKCNLTGYNNSTVAHRFFEYNKDYTDALINFGKIKNKTYGVNRKKDSNAVWFDIDNRHGRTATQELKKLLNFLNLTLDSVFVLEQNQFTGGLHAYILLDDASNLTKEYFSKLESKLKENDIIVECEFESGILRLPLSYEYLPIRITEDILDSEFIKPKHLFKSFNDFINTSFNRKETLYSDFIKTTKDLLPKTQKELYFSKKINRFVRDIITKPSKLYKPVISKGSRWDVQKTYVPYLKARGYSFEEVIKELQNIDSGCLGYKNNFDKCCNELKKFYDKCESTYIKTKELKEPSSFVSNAKYVDEYSRSIITNPKVVSNLVQKYNYEYCKLRGMNSLSNEKLSILEKQLPLFILEFIGKMKYDLITNKKLKDTRLSYLNGFQLPDNYLKSLQEYVNKELELEGNLSKNNIQYMKKAIMNVLGLKEIYIHIHKNRNWLNGLCKSYNIKSHCQINELISHLLNQVIDNRFFITTPSNIYNISIKEITDFNQLLKVEWVDVDVPIPI